MSFCIIGSALWTLPPGPSANIIIDPHGIVRTELNTPAATSAHRPSASVTAAPGASAGSPLSAPRGQAAAYAALDPIGPGATGVTAESGGLEPSYRQRGEALGMPVWVSEVWAAVLSLSFTSSFMLPRGHTRCLLVVTA